MTWLRIDDGYDTHPKLLELTEQQRWRWTRVLISCARHDTHGRVSRSVLESVGLFRAVNKLLTAKLLDEDAEGYVVHDWPIYNGNTVGEKVDAFLLSHPDATANEVYRGVGGKREIVLAEVVRYRNGSQPVPGYQNGGSQGTGKVVPGAVPDRYQSGSRARAPVPSLSTSTNNGSLDVAADDADEQELERLNTLLAQAAIEDMGT